MYVGSVIGDISGMLAPPKDIGGVKLVTDIFRLQHPSSTSINPILDDFFPIETILISRFPVLINCLWFYHTCKMQVFQNPFLKLFI